MTLDVKKSNSSNETPNVMRVGVEKYGLNTLEVSHIYVPPLYLLFSCVMGAWLLDQTLRKWPWPLL
jgi:hypothetical protein